MHSLASPPIELAGTPAPSESHPGAEEVDALRRERDRLAEECRQLRALIDSVPEYLYTKDLDGRYVVNNRTNLTLLGVAEESAVAGRTVFDLFPHEIASIYHADDRKVLETGVAVVDRPEPFVTPDGESRWYWTTKVPILGRDGEIRGLAGVSRDVTDHLRALDALATREEELRLALTAARFGIWSWDADSNRLHLSPEILSLLGYEPNSHDGHLRSLLTWVHPDDREGLMNLVSRVKVVPTPHSRVELTCRFLDSDGQVRWLAASGEARRFPDGKLASIQGVALDVTERNRALLEAQQQETDLRLALNAAQMGIWIYSAADDGLTLSLEIWKMLGVEPRPLVTSDWLLEWVHPEDREDWQAKYRAVQLEPVSDVGELDFIDHQYRIVTSSGETRWVHARGRVERDADGWATGVRGVVLDITETRQAAEALRESEERYRALVDVCPDAIYVSVGGNVAFANRACAELFGATDPAGLVDRQGRLVGII